jgi:hypothetical protein
MVRVHKISLKAKSGLSLELEVSLHSLPLNAVAQKATGLSVVKHWLYFTSRSAQLARSSRFCLDFSRKDSAVFLASDALRIEGLVVAVVP